MLSLKYCQSSGIDHGSFPSLPMTRFRATAAISLTGNRPDAATAAAAPLTREVIIYWYCCCCGLLLRRCKRRLDSTNFSSHRNLKGKKVCDPPPAAESPGARGVWRGFGAFGWGCALACRHYYLVFFRVQRCLACTPAPNKKDSSFSSSFRVRILCCTTRLFLSVSVSVSVCSSRGCAVLRLCTHPSTPTAHKASFEPAAREG